MASTKDKMRTDLASLGDNLGDEGVSATQETLRIILEENENIPPNGQFIQVGGSDADGNRFMHSYLVRPGEAIDAPLDLIEVLDNAVASTPIMDAQQSIIGYRDKLRFPYRVVRKGGARA